MAEGNDAKAAAQELADREGLEPNADRVIKEAQALYPRDLQAASMKAENEDAKGDIDVDALAKHVDGEIQDFAVRGDSVVVVALVDGAAVKSRVALADLGGSKSRRAAAKKS